MSSVLEARGLDRLPGPERLDRELRPLLERSFLQALRSFELPTRPPGPFAKWALSRAGLRALCGESAPTLDVLQKVTTAPVLKDLALAYLCEGGDERAWDLLVHTHLPRLTRVAQRLRIPGDQAEEAAREVLSDLVAHPGHHGTRTRLGTYDGSGPLADFLAVILVRHVRASRDFRACSLKGFDPRGTAQEPGVLAARAEFVAHLQAALGEAWPELTRAEIRALVLRYCEERKQREIAQLLGVGEPRVSRLLGRALGKVRRTLRRRLPAGLEMDRCSAEEVSPALAGALLEGLQRCGRTLGAPQPAAAPCAL